VGFKIKLHHLTFIAFTLIASVPVFFLAAWVQQSALDKEVKAVAEKHLLVAQNATGALSLYIKDVKSSFSLVISNLNQKTQINGLPDLLKSLNFLHVCLINPDGRVLEAISGTDAKPPEQIPRQVFEKLIPYIQQAQQQPETIVFSDLIRDAKGFPWIFLIRAISPQQTVLGIVTTDYVKQVQKSIAFGERGHAAIVDSKGQVMAHPSKPWEESMKNISRIKPVQLMKEGKTGVTQFYSPPMQADMIAGHTAVPETGWGVMVPQPFQELQQRTHDVRTIALTITILGITVAGLISWFLAGYLTRPIQAVVSSVQFMILPSANNTRINCFNRPILIN